MKNPQKVLQMSFATKDGGTLKMSIGNTRKNLTAEEIKATMDTIVSSGIFITGKGIVTEKTRARYITQDIEEVEIAE